MPFCLLIPVSTVTWALRSFVFRPTFSPHPCVWLRCIACTSWRARETSDVLLRTGQYTLLQTRYWGGGGGVTELGRRTWVTVVTPHSYLRIPSLRLCISSMSIEVGCPSGALRRHRGSLTMNAVVTSETSVSTYQTARSNIPKRNQPPSNPRHLENLRYHLHDLFTESGFVCLWPLVELNTIFVTSFTAIAGRLVCVFLSDGRPLSFS
jgi:hypothetical protein